MTSAMSFVAKWIGLLPAGIGSELGDKNTRAFGTYNLSLYRSAEKLLDILIERG
jgi:hypothetical protein